MTREERKDIEVEIVSRDAHALLSSCIDGKVLRPDTIGKIRKGSISKECSASRHRACFTSPCFCKCHSRDQG